MSTSFTRLFTVVPRAVAIAALATGFAGFQVQAQDNSVPFQSLEDAIESNTDAVLLPTSQLGTLTFRDCAEPCKVRSVEINAQSAFFIGSTQVTLAEFSAYVRRTGSQSLTVFHPPGRMTATRVMVVGQAQ
jgi:formylglycine-generating enzyme required for sulfatase activity